MQFVRSCFVLFLITLLSSQLVYAEPRNLTGRFGLGYTNQIAVSESSTIPAISAKYHFSKSSAISGGLGFDTRSNNNSLATGLKYYQNLFLEDNLLFYAGAGLALVSHNGSKLQVSAFFGPEFFFPGLSSLGFSIEAGVRGDKYSGSFAMKTIGDSFISGGIHFYF